MSNSYFSEVALSSVSAYPTDPQIISNIRGPHKLLAVCTAGSIELSFTGSDLTSESFKLDAANGSNNSGSPKAINVKVIKTRDYSKDK